MLRTLPARAAVAGIAHVILAVEDDGAPALTSHRRATLTVRPATARR